MECPSRFHKRKVLFRANAAINEICVDLKNKTALYIRPTYFYQRTIGNSYMYLYSFMKCLNLKHQTVSLQVMFLINVNDVVSAYLLVSVIWRRLHGIGKGVSSDSAINILPQKKKRWPFQSDNFFIQQKQQFQMLELV